MNNRASRVVRQPWQAGTSNTGLSLVLNNERQRCVRAAATNTPDTEITLRHAFDLPPGCEKDLIGLNGQVDPEKLRLYIGRRLSELIDMGCIQENLSLYGVGVGGKGRVSIEKNGDYREGIIAMDRGSTSGDIRFSKGGLIVESQGVFSSARANACVCGGGKWMYEVALETAGIQQLGWATLSSAFTREEGVGDSPDSYAYDGRRVKKWNACDSPYGQPWVAGDIIGCFLDLDSSQISFSRNGTPLGIAFENVGNAQVNSPPSSPYYPAISLSEGERSHINFGGKPFKYPAQDYAPLQPPPLNSLIKSRYLLGCLKRLFQLESQEVVASMSPIERLHRIKPLLGDSLLVATSEICKPLIPILSVNTQAHISESEYIVWAALLPFLMELYRPEPPHDGSSVDNALDLLLSSLSVASAASCIAQLMEALAFACRTSPINLMDCPYTGSYSHLALTCHLLRRDDVLLLWWKSGSFELCLEGFLTKKGPNRNDLEALMPTIWWPGSREDLCSESNMRQTATALLRAIDKIEELQWEVCRYVLDFVPPSDSPGGSLSFHAPGSIFKAFLKHLVNKNKYATRNMPPPGLSDNSVLVTAYTVLLRFLSEGSGGSSFMDAKDETKDDRNGVGFLHRPGKRRFKARLFLDLDPCLRDFARLGGTYGHLSKTHSLDNSNFKDVEWEEGSMEDDPDKVTHSGKERPCCCSGIVAGSNNNGKNPVRLSMKILNGKGSSGNVSESSATGTSEYSRRNCREEMGDKPGASRRGNSLIEASSVRQSRKAGFLFIAPSDTLREEELLDMMILLYHLGVASNFKQASYYLTHQHQYIAQLDDADRQIRGEKHSSEYLKHLKEARAVYREDLIDCVRQSTWYRVCLFSKWKQRGMYAMCMWIVELLLVLSEQDAVFSFVPEYYVETLLDCFHAIRRSDPPFVSPSALLQQGLTSLVTFLVTHFNDSRIVNSDIRDILLQSISVLVQYKEHVLAFESNAAAIDIMPSALLNAFDNRFWIPVTSILLRLCKGCGFGASKSSTHGESCSVVFQNLLRECCLVDEKLLSSFLNRLFNTLNWTITEFSISMKEMQEQTDQHQGADFQQRKCVIMFELSCNLERILEYFTRELPQAFLSGSKMNLVRLCELLNFVLNHTATISDTNLFPSSVRQGQPLEKVHRATILAPLVGIVLNLISAKTPLNCDSHHDLAQAILSADISSSTVDKFQYLTDYNWSAVFKGDPSIARLSELKAFVGKLSSHTKQKGPDTAVLHYVMEAVANAGSGDEKEDICSICYAHEVDTVFSPCKHTSCGQCISRHLLNNQRCFFCNTNVNEIRPISASPPSKNGFATEPEKIDPLPS